ncbi:MAG: Fe-S cluster assembly protein HesB [Nocardioides sp.]|nr:Fe-S cluster assembly protein HesB [Nocardioides sp.]
MPTLHITGDETADELLSEDAFSLVVGMLLDQQYKMEDAFKGPQKLRARLGHVDPGRIAAMDPEEFKIVASQPPAIHRFPGSMSTKVHALAQIVVGEYDGDASRIWTEAKDAKDLLRRMQALPGFGKQKAQIFVALLAKQVGVRPEGWEQVVGDYSLEGYRSVADVVSPESLQKVREYKQQKKAAAKAAG